MANVFLVAADVVVERNRIVNCDRGIGFGLVNAEGGHQGGMSVIRNNLANRPIRQPAGAPRAALTNNLERVEKAWFRDMAGAISG